MPLMENTPILPELSLTSNLTEQGRKFLTSFGEFKDYANGIEILKQGSSDHYMYLMLDGSAEVFCRGFKGDVIVGTINQGSSFGEFSMLFEQQPNASIRTTSDCKVWRIEAKEFKKFMSEAPGAANLLLIDMLHLMGNRLRNTGQLVVGNTILKDSEG